MKHAFHFFLLFVSISLIGCGGSKSKTPQPPLVTTAPNATGSTATGTGSGTPHVAVFSTKAFLNSLYKSERRMERLYGVTFVLNPRFEKIKMPSPKRITLLARAQGLKRRLFKKKLLKELYTYGLNLQHLYSHRNEILNYSSFEYQEVQNKTKYALKISTKKRIKSLQKEVEKLESQISNLGFETYVVLKSKDLNISLPVYKGPSLSSKRLERLLSRKAYLCEEASDFKSPQGSFVLSELKINPDQISDKACRNSEALKLIAKFLNENSDVKSANEIFLTANEEALLSYNEKADSYLSENKIFLDANEPTGFKAKPRYQWQRDQRELFDSSVGVLQGQQAFQNNLYENLSFKKQIVAARLQVLKDLMTKEELDKLRRELILLNRALAPISYDPNLNLKAGTSPTTF